LEGIHQKDDKLLNIDPKIKTYGVTKPWLLFLLQNVLYGSTFYLTIAIKINYVTSCYLCTMFNLSTQRVCFFENSRFLSNLLTSIQTHASLRRAEHCIKIAGRYMEYLQKNNKVV